MCVCVCTPLTRHPSLGPHPSASPHVSSRRCRCTLPSTPADLQSAGLDLLCHAPSRDKAILDSDPWLRFNRFLIRLIYGSFFSSNITKDTFSGRPSRCNTAQLVVSGECLAHTQPSCFMPSCACPARRRKCIGCDGVPLPSLPRCLALVPPLPTSFGHIPPSWPSRLSFHTCATKLTCLTALRRRHTS